jgi:hypothetical protein
MSQPEVNSIPQRRCRAAEKKAKAVSVADYADTWMEQRNVKPRIRSATTTYCGLHIGYF